jgi:hypothetical protein
MVEDTSFLFCAARTELGSPVFFVMLANMDPFFLSLLFPENGGQPRTHLF